MHERTPLRRTRPAAAAVAVALTLALAGLVVGLLGIGPAGAEPGDSPRLSAPGYLLDRGRVTTLEVPDALTQTVSVGVNDLGDVTGKYDGPDGKFHGFLRDARGRYTRIDVPGALGTYASKVNDRRQVVGAYNTASPRIGAPGTKGFVWDRGRFTTIAVPDAQYTQAFGINNRGDVVGEYLDAGGTNHGFLWRRGRFTTIDVPGWVSVSVADINDHGDLVGLGGASLDEVRGFVRHRGRFTKFDAPGKRYTLALGINNRRQVVGFGMDDLDLTGARGFVATRGGSGRFTTVDVRNAPRTTAWDINEHQAIVGTYENVAAAVPPAAAAQRRATHKDVTRA